MYRSNVLKKVPTNNVHQIPHVSKKITSQISSNCSVYSHAYTAGLALFVHLLAIFQRLITVPVRKMSVESLSLSVSQTAAAVAEAFRDALEPFILAVLITTWASTEEDPIISSRVKHRARKLLQDLCPVSSKIIFIANGGRRYGLAT